MIRLGPRWATHSSENARLLAARLPVTSSHIGRRARVSCVRVSYSRYTSKWRRQADRCCWSTVRQIARGYGRKIILYKENKAKKERCTRYMQRDASPSKISPFLILNDDVRRANLRTQKDEHKYFRLSNQ